MSGGGRPSPAPIIDSRRLREYVAQERRRRHQEAVAAMAAAAARARLRGVSLPA